jgi:hypothetical protein
VRVIFVVIIARFPLSSPLGMLSRPVTHPPPEGCKDLAQGGAPGIIWSDYACDGFATETQKPELKPLTGRFRRMMREAGAGGG